MPASITAAATILLVTFMVCITASRAWRAWLDVRRMEIERRPSAAVEEVGVRIELAAVKERLKKLEAIASGVEF